MLIYISLDSSIDKLITASSTRASHHVDEWVIVEGVGFPNQARLFFICRKRLGVHLIAVLVASAVVSLTSVRKTWEMEDLAMNLCTCYGTKASIKVYSSLLALFYFSNQIMINSNQRNQP